MQQSAKQKECQMMHEERARETALVIAHNLHIDDDGLIRLIEAHVLEALSEAEEARREAEAGERDDD